MKKILIRLAAVAVALLLAVGLTELIVRMLDPHGISDSFNAERYREEVVEVCAPPRIFRHLHNVDVDLRRYSVRTDSRGARGPERATPKPAGVKRAVFLGDSVTFGWGVEQEDTFVSLVQAPLTERTGDTWETVNLGHMFHDTTQELGVFDEIGVAYEPDLVVLVFVDNDIVPTAEALAAQIDPMTDPNVSDEAKDVIRWSQRFNRMRPYLPYISALLTFKYVQQHPVANTGSTEHATELGLDVHHGWALCQDAIRGFRDRCAAAGVPFVVLDYYTLEMVETFCAEEGIPYGSIAFTDEQKATYVRNSDADAHANARGHRYLAEHVMRELDRLQLP